MMKSKLSLASLEGKLTRAEMKSLMAGSSGGSGPFKCCLPGGAACSGCTPVPVCASPYMAVACNG